MTRQLRFIRSGFTSSVNSSGVPTGLAISNAAPKSDMFRTRQSIVEAPNVIDPPLNVLKRRMRRLSELVPGIGLTMACPLDQSLIKIAFIFQWRLHRRVWFDHISCATGSHVFNIRRQSEALAGSRSNSRAWRKGPSGRTAHRKYKVTSSETASSKQQSHLSCLNCTIKELSFDTCQFLLSYDYSDSHRRSRHESGRCIYCLRFDSIRYRLRLFRRRLFFCCPRSPATCA